MDIKTLRPISAILGVAILVSACETLDPYTRESETSKATKGALIGAGIGAVAGLLSGDDAVERRQHAMIGAGIGALAGGLVGNYMDRQEAKLRAELEGTGVSVVRNGDNITLNMPGNVTFASNSSALQPNFFGVLTSVGKVLTEFDQTVVEVAGHTDSTGSDSHNMTLSQRRANTVGEYLYTQAIMDQRIIAVGMGEHHPVADNTTPEGREMNRRVEITLVPVTAG